MAFSDISKGKEISRSLLIDAIKEKINTAARFANAGYADRYTGDTAQDVIFSENIGSVFTDDDQVETDRIGPGGTSWDSEFDRIDLISASMDVDAEAIVNTILSNAFLCTQIRRVSWIYITDPMDPDNGALPTDPRLARLDLQDQIWYNQFDDLGRRYGIEELGSDVSVDIVAQAGSIDVGHGATIDGPSYSSGVPQVDENGVPLQHVGSVTYDPTAKLLHHTAQDKFVAVHETRSMNANFYATERHTRSMSLIEVDSIGRPVLDANGEYVIVGGSGSITLFEDYVTRPGLSEMISEVSDILEWHRENAPIIELSVCHTNCHSNCHGSRTRR